MRTMLLLGTLFASTVFASTGNGQSSLSLRQDASLYGHYSVGFRSQTIGDPSRTPLIGEVGIARKIVISLWYPAKRGPRTMTPLKYLGNAYSAPGSGKNSTADQLLQTWSKRLGFTGNEQKSPEAILQAVTGASENAESIHTVRGVIIYSPGAGEEGFDNFLLCEVLASHGYVVAAARSVGFLQRSVTPTAKNLETSARDMETVLGYVRSSIPESSTAKLAMIGYSWGGLAAMLVQMRNAEVIGVASLDGSIASYEDQARETAWFDISAMRVPYLFFSAADTLEKHDRFLQKVRYAPVTHIHLAKMNHGDFQSFRYAINKFQSDSEKQAVAARAGYELVVAQTVNFFDWCFLRDANDLNAFSAPSARGSDHLSLAKRNALPAPPSEAQFFELIRGEGVAKAREKLNEYRSRDPELVVFNMQALAEIGFSIFDGGKQEEGIDVLRLVVDSYPEDYKPHGYLGSLYEESGNVAGAIEQYRIALKMATEGTGGDPIQRKNDIALFRGLVGKLEKSHPSN